MMVKPGIKTTEFWITAVVNIVSAVLAIMAARGLVAQEESELWVVLAQAIAVAVAPIVMAITTNGYVQARARVKSYANGG